jgi:serine protease inhibitor
MKRFVVLIISAVLLLGACSVNAPKGSYASFQAAVPVKYKAVMKEQPVTALDPAFVSRVNTFGLKAAGILSKTDENLALSPASIETALCMTRAGAAGDTAKDMAKALGFEGLSDEQITAACKSLMWRSNTGGMEAANALWAGEGLTLSDKFAGICTEDFMADAGALKIPGAMDEINSWAKDKTHGRIDKIIMEELDPSTRMVLANALYFLGKWAAPFEANETYDEQFAALEETVKASFMHVTRGVPYYENKNFKMISLEFKSDENEGKYAMAFILPAEGKDAGALLSSLDGEKFADALFGLKSRQTIISLPKFEFSYYTSLKDTLIGLGMGTAFSDNADFSAMTKEPNSLYISEVLHKCFVKADELGAEAAAVTVVVMEEGMAMPPENAAVFKADRPFIFAIYSVEDGTIGFLGTVNDPTKK